MWKYRLGALFILILGALLGWYLYTSEISGSRSFRLGLDLSGGTQLLYKADLSAIPGSNVDETMNGRCAANEHPPPTERRLMTRIRSSSLRQ